MKKAILPALTLSILPLVVLFESLFLDASLMSFDYRITPPFSYLMGEDDLPRVMNMASGDINAWIMPETLLQVERIKRGELPLWNDREHSGQPLMATLGFTPLYPPNLLYFCMNPVRAYAVSMALHVLILGLGMWLFLRHIPLASSAALMGGVSISLCAFITVHLHNPVFVQTAAWLPWMMLAARALVEDPRFRRTAALGGVTGLCLLGGFPQISILALLVVAAWFLVSLIRRPSGGRVRTLTAAAIAIALGCMLSSIQLLPASELLSESTRSHGFPPEVLAQKRFAPQSLIGLVLPRFFGPAVQEFSSDNLRPRLIFEFPSVRAWQQIDSSNGFEENAVFLGLIPLFLGLTSFLRRWRLREMFPRALLLLSLIFGMGYLFSSGYCGQIPGITSGSPKRVLFLVSFALAWLAALEFDRFRKEGRSPWLLPFGLIYVALGAMVALPFEQWLFPDSTAGDRAWFRETVAADLIGAIAAGLVLLLTAVAVRARRARLALLLLLAGATGELVLFGRHLNPPQRLQGLFEPTPVIEWLEGQGACRDKRLVAFSSSEVLPASVAQVFGLRSCLGQLSMPVRQTADLMRVLEPGIINDRSPGPTAAFRDLASLTSPLLDMLGARYVVTGGFGYKQIMAALDDLPGIELVYASRDEGLAVFERQAALPPAFLVRNLRAIPDRERRLSYLGSADFDPRMEAVVEQAVEGFPAPASGEIPSQRDAVAYARPLPERIEIDAVIESRAFLVVSETSFPGWRAEVNGREVPLVRANHALMGVSLPPGTHRVVLTYEPISFYAGMGLTLAGLLLCLTMLIWPSRPGD
ncbi:MAG: YfhO family protein [Planctomycetota bacterium]